jgi:predicted RNA-binding Zn-ribbon protein involved in translation (DUF1610 family)
MVESYLDVSEEVVGEPVPQDDQPGPAVMPVASSTTKKRPRSTGGNHLCPECGKTYQNRSILNTHRLRQHGSDHQQYLLLLLFVFLSITQMDTPTLRIKVAVRCRSSRLP